MSHVHQVGLPLVAEYKEWIRGESLGRFKKRCSVPRIGDFFCLNRAYCWWVAQLNSEKKIQYSSENSEVNIINYQAPLVRDFSHYHSFGDLWFQTWLRDNLMFSDPHWTCIDRLNCRKVSENSSVGKVISAIESLRIQTPPEDFGLRVPIPSEKNRNLGGPIPFGQDIPGFLGNTGPVGESPLPERWSRRKGAMIFTKTIMGVAWLAIDPDSRWYRWACFTYNLRLWWLYGCWLCLDFWELVGIWAVTKSLIICCV